MATSAEYLAGMFDGEGCVLHEETKGKRSVCIANLDYGLIEACRDALECVGIFTSTETSQLMPNGKRLYRITVANRDGLEKFHERVPFRSEAKRAKLEAALASYKYRAQKRHTDAVRIRGAA